MNDPIKSTLALLLLGLVACPTVGQDTTRSSVSSAGVQGNARSRSPSISADGRFVAFWSDTTNLVAGDTNGFADVFVHDRQTGTTTRVNVSSKGTQATGGHSYFPSISADGRFVAFQSGAMNLVNGDTNGRVDVFVHDRQTGATTRVSLGPNGSQAIGGNSTFPSISGDGNLVAFQSGATNLVARGKNGVDQVYVHDRRAGTTTRASVDAAGNPGNGKSEVPVLSPLGLFVTFWGPSTNLVPGPNNGIYHIFVHDLKTRTTTRASVNTAGILADGASAHSSISVGGRFVTFWSFAKNLVKGVNSGVSQIYVRDRQAGTTTCVSLGPTGAPGNRHSYVPTISFAGRYVAFKSHATNLVPGDLNGQQDIFVHDRQSRRTTLESLSSTGAQGNRSSNGASISMGGRFVAFYSFATNLVLNDNNGVDDIFVRDRRMRVLGGGCPGAPTPWISGSLTIGTTLQVDATGCQGGGAGSLDMLFFGPTQQMGALWLRTTTGTVACGVVILPIVGISGPPPIRIPIPNAVPLVGVKVSLQSICRTCKIAGCFDNLTQGIQLTIG